MDDEEWPRLLRLAPARARQGAERLKRVHAILAPAPGVSCDQTCGEQQRVCFPAGLPRVNSCEAMNALLAGDAAQLGARRDAAEGLSLSLSLSL